MAEFQAGESVWVKPAGGIGARKRGVVIRRAASPVSPTDSVVWYKVKANGLGEDTYAEWRLEARRESLDDVTGQEWNAASAAVTKKEDSVRDFKVGDEVEVDMNMPSSSWHGVRGVVIEERVARKSAKVRIDHDPTGAREGLERTLYNLTLASARPDAKTEDVVNDPQHYGGADNPYEVIKVLEAWGLHKDAYLFNVVKYVARAGKKDPAAELQDHEKALYYLKSKIAQLKKESK